MRIIGVRCTHRLDPLLVLKAFQDGADGLMILGCHPGDCQHQQDSLFAQRCFALMQRLLEFVALPANRLLVEWVSASEGKKFAEVAIAFTQRVRGLGPSSLHLDAGPATAMLEQARA